MELLPLALIQSNRATTALMHSAEPGAPTVSDHRRGPRAVRPRLATAHLLERMARALTPSPNPQMSGPMSSKSPSACRPAH